MRDQLQEPRWLAVNKAVGGVPIHEESVTHTAAFNQSRLMYLPGLVDVPVGVPARVLAQVARQASHAAMLFLGDAL
jgi:hypothetical protein